MSIRKTPRSGVTPCPHSEARRGGQHHFGAVAALGMVLLTSCTHHTTFEMYSGGEVHGEVVKHDRRTLHVIDEDSGKLVTLNKCAVEDYSNDGVGTAIVGASLLAAGLFVGAIGLNAEPAEPRNTTASVPFDGRDAAYMFAIPLVVTGGTLLGVGLFQSSGSDERLGSMYCPGGTGVIIRR
jgi:hypothetical protein